MQQLIQQQLITPSQLQQLMQQQSLLFQQQVSLNFLPTPQLTTTFSFQQHHQLAEISRKQLEQTLQNLQEQLQVCTTNYKPIINK